MYTRGNNIRKYVHEITSINMALDQLKILPEDTISDIIKGLLMSTHVTFG